MSEIPIYSPSYRRAIGVRTHRILPGVRYCVAEAEEDPYRAAGHDVIVMPDAAQGNVARARNWILEHARAKGEADFLIIDDDIRAVKRWANHSKAVALVGDDLTEFIEQGFQMAREWGVRLWGVQFNWDKGVYRECAPFSTLSFLTASWHGFAGCPLKYDEALPLKEDYDLTLQELNQWRRLLRFNFVHLIKDDHENRGGCAAMRNVAVEREQLESFRQKWGNSIVKSDQGKSRDKSRRREQTFDINPIIRVPIPGV